MAFSRLSSDDIVISSEAVSVPIWTGNKTTISGSDLSVNNNQIIGLSGDYYLDVYAQDDGGVAEVQFSIAYADVDGSGSNNYNNAVNGYSPSRTIYGQYRSLVLGDEESDFNFNEDSASANFWAVSIDRARYKENLMVGSLKLSLTGPQGSLVLVDSGVITGSVRYIDSGRVYGLLQSSSTVNTGSSYGYFLPDIGTILLDCGKVGNATGYSASRFTAVTTDSSRTSTGGAYYGLGINSNMYALTASLSSITLRASETVSSNYIFIRARNSEFNYSINPSNITDTGELVHNTMINSPETYITTVGLYNEGQDLLAVAKLSRPLPKNFSKEALIRIKLDY